MDDVELTQTAAAELDARNSPMEFAFGVKHADGKITTFGVEFLENGYVRVKAQDADTGERCDSSLEDRTKTVLVQWINGKWHRHKLSKDDGVVDACPVHADGRHRHVHEAMTSKEQLMSTDPRVVGNVNPPMKCACGQVKYEGLA